MLSASPYNSDFPIVRFWTVESDIPADGKRWPEICYAEEATGKVALKDGT